MTWICLLMRIITRNKKFFFTGEEHLSLEKNFFLMVIRESDSGLWLLMRIITRNKKFFFTGEFKGSSSPERVQLGYSLEMIQLDPPEAEEHWSLKNFFLMRIITRNKKIFFHWWRTFELRKKNFFLMVIRETDSGQRPESVS